MKLIPAAVGIALVGDLSASLPTPDQLEATAGLVAWLLQDLGLGASSVRGHREMVATPCPGETFAAVWKPRLMSLALRRLAGEAEPEPGTDLLESEVRTPAELGTDSPTPELEAPSEPGTDSPTPELESPSEPGTDLPEPDVQAPSEPAPMPRHDAEHGQWPVPPPDESSTATEMAAQGPEPTPPQAIDSIEVESSAGDEDREPG